jgi:hypothetical protein
MSESETREMIENEESPADAALAERLARHFRAELDGQLGRSAAAFRLHVLAERNAPRPKPQRAWGNGPWAIGLAGAAVAASIALLISSIPSGGISSPGVVPGAPTRVVNPLRVDNPAIRMNQTVRTHLIDGGTVIGPDGRPWHVVRKVNVEENHWLNEQTGERVEQVVPTEEEMKYELKTY